MKSKTSLFSSALISNNFKRFWWTSTLYAIILFLIGPLLLLTMQNKPSMISQDPTYIIDRLKSANTLLYIVIPIFLGAMLFRYIQNSKSVTLLHSMPYTREALYFSNVLSGLLLLLIPNLINSIIMLCIVKFPQFGGLIPASVIWSWSVQSILIQTTIFSLTVMVGMFTGSSIAQIIFTVILNVLPLFFIASLSYLFRDLVYGFMDLSSYYIESASKFIPILQITRTLSEIWLVDILLILLTCAIALWVYKRRDLETSGDVISSSIIKPIFKYGVTVCAMLTGASYVKGIYNQVTPNIFVFIFFALLGYVISEMLIRKSFNILSSYKGFLGFIAVLLIAVGIIKTDTLGFERRIPDPANVSSIAFGYNDDVRALIDDKYYKNRYSSIAERYMDYPKILKESQNIKNVVELHKVLIKSRDSKVTDDTIYIGYKLKNGKYILRSYKIDKYKLSKNLNTIYNTLEYKKLVFGILNIDISKINDVYIRDAVYSPNPIRLTDKKEISRVFELAKQHIINTPYDSIIGNASPIYNLDFTYQNMYVEKYAPQKMEYNTITVPVNKYGKTLLNDLASHDYNKTLIKPEDVKKLVIKESVSAVEYEYQARNGITRRFMSKPDYPRSENVIKTITDPSEIKKIIDNRGDLLTYSSEKKFYSVTGFDKNNNEFMLGYTNKL